jgi:hypothetical protein
LDYGDRLGCADLRLTLAYGGETDFGREMSSLTARPELADALDSCHSLFLREIWEPEDNVLRLAVQETFVNPKAETRTVCGTPIENVHRVESTAVSRIFELTWNQYIAYGVTNESFCSPDDERVERSSGRLFRTYAKSPFLEYISRASFASAQYPGPFTHICIVTEMHIIDVVSTQAPEIRLLLASDLATRSRGIAFEK